MSIQNDGNVPSEQIEIIATTSDHTVPSPLFSMTDKAMAIKLIELLDEQDLSIIDTARDEDYYYLWEKNDADVERVANILRKLFN